MPASKSPKKIGKKKVAVRRRSTAPRKPSVRRARTPRRTRATTVRQPVTHTIPFERHPDNPILSPLAEHSWEANQTFNAAALYDGGKVHLVYRSIGHDGLSRFGYATSENGIDIDERAPTPVFCPVLEPDTAPVIGWYASGGSWGGAEDPRLASFGGRVYMLYTGFDRGGFPRVALTSIGRDDFLNGRWKWYRPKFISPPGEVHKNWVLFPEMVNGKYAILHSMSPKIEIEYLDDLDFKDVPYVPSAAYHRADIPVKDGWEKSIRGPGPTPLKTKYGWLVLYHATTAQSGYTMGAMLLDLDDPTKVIVRADAPVLEPEEWYEMQGWKGNIIYSCGAAIIGKDLLVYYGGADSVLCVAKTELEPFLEALIAQGKPKLKKPTK